MMTTTTHQAAITRRAAQAVREALSEVVPMEEEVPEDGSENLSHA